MGASSTTVPIRAGTIFDSLNNPLPNFVRGSAIALCFYFTAHYECSSCSRKDIRLNLKSNTNILRHRITQPIQKELFQNRECSLCSFNGIQKALALFLVLQHYSALVPAFERHHKKQKSYWPNWKLGYRTQQIFHWFCSQIIHPISGISIFHYWLDTLPTGRS